MRLQIWVCLICVKSPYSNGAVQIRVGLELAKPCDFCMLVLKRVAAIKLNIGCVQLAGYLGRKFLRFPKLAAQICDMSRSVIALKPVNPC